MGKVFVTGGSGFIGSHLIAGLISLGHSVTNYDIAPSSENPEAAHIAGDIMDLNKLREAMRGHSAVCHLAAMVGVVACQADEEKVHRINFTGSERVLEACGQNGIKNVLFASSSEVYGEGAADALLTENAGLNPLSAYGKAKMRAETLFEEYGRLNKAKSTSVRYCNVYGPRQRVDFVISIFINNVLKHEPLTVCERGQQTRNYTFIEDAVNGTVRALLRPGEDYQVFNICSGDTLKVADVADKIISFNKSGTVKYADYSEVGRMRKYEVINRIPSNGKAQEMLGFSPSVPFDEGIRRTFEYYRKNLLDAGTSQYAFVC